MRLNIIILNEKLNLTPLKGSGVEMQLTETVKMVALITKSDIAVMQIRF